MSRIWARHWFGALVVVVLAALATCIDPPTPEVADAPESADTEFDDDDAFTDSTPPSDWYPNR